MTYKYTHENVDGSRRIDSKATLIDALDGRDVLSVSSFGEIIDFAESLVRSEYPDVSRGALSNVRGSWYEWLLAIGALEFCYEHIDAYYLVLLPNISQYDCARLYVEKIHDYIQDLRTKVDESADVKLITSNPDFVIVDNSLQMNMPQIISGSVTAKMIEQIDQVYLQLEHRCQLDQIKGYVAVKLSLRPDRRLQIAHEGSLMKALYRHVQTREWIIDAPGIKYYAVTSKATDADKNALKTVATHSITDVGSKPKAAVDSLMCVFSGAELQIALKRMLIE